MLDPLEGLRQALADRYIIDREIGHGGSATVYLAQDRKLARTVAIKVLAPELSLAVRTERFLQEIEISAGFQHPHILPLHDSGEAAGLFYYVMPYVSGETLRDRLARDGRLPLDEAIRITQEVASALTYAHAQGVIHRDIKPANILLSAGHAIVADFGIARAKPKTDRGGLTQTGASLGTPGYMSPEQAAGQEIDARSDIYSLGCVLYEMLAGGPPFIGASAQALIAQHIVDTVPPLRRSRPEIPRHVVRVLERALAKRPEDRFATAEDLSQSLSQRHSVGMHLPVLRWLRPSRMALSVVLGAVLVGATWQLTRRWGGGEEHPPEGTPDPSHVAVLYFEDLNQDTSLSPVAAGLTEDLIDQLGQVRQLHVISANGVRPFRDRAPPLDSIARRLGVGTIVTGSVARSGGRLRVAVRLIDPTTGRQLHSRTVERPMSDLFVLLDSIATDVTTVLREGLGSEVRLRQRRAGTENVAAWELVQRADKLREDAEELTRTGDPRAIATVVVADSLYALSESLDSHWLTPIVARGSLGLTVARLQTVQENTPDSAHGRTAEGSPTSALVLQWVVKGLRDVGRALAINSHDAHALAVRGALRFELWSDQGGPDSLLSGAERDLHQAVAADSGLAGAWYALGWMYMYTARFQEASQAARHALDADAYLSEAWEAFSILFFTALHDARYADAASWCSQGRKRFPNQRNFIDCELRLLAWSAQGPAQVDRAWRILDTIEAKTPDSTLWGDHRMLVAAVIARSGWTDSATAVVGRTHAALTRRRWQADDMAFEEAYVWLLMGQRKEALDRLANYLTAFPQYRPYVARSPWFRPLWPDPRFQALVASTQ